MIKLFRNTRRQLLSENKFSKYLAYATGEIFLVVVGILIAVWINGKNQERINEAKAVTILKEIQKDLKSDFTVSQSVFKNIITTDSIAKLLLWDKITDDELFALPPNKSYDIVFYPFIFNSSDNGYLNYKRNLNNIPAKYDSISNDLKSLYGIIRANGEAQKERLKSIVIENHDKVNNYDWVVDSEKGFMSDEGKNYFSRDLEYKKILLKYMNGIENVFTATQIYDIQATEIHNAISKILNSEDYRPSPFSFKSYSDSAKEKNFNGKYKLKETINPSYFPKIIKLKEVDNKLHLFTEEWPEYQFYSNDKTTFLKVPDSVNGYLCVYMSFTPTENKEFFLAVGKDKYSYYTKIND